MIIHLPQKFTDRELDHLVVQVMEYLHGPNNDKLIFDLTETEYIANQELLVFTAFLKTFVASKVPFSVRFFKPGISTSEINDRVKRQIIEIWQVWKIWTVLDNQEYYEFFGLDGNSVERLQKEINYYPKSSEIYSRHGVTPFVAFDYINNYKQAEIQRIIAPFYDLNAAISDILRTNNCHHPFTTSSLSKIINEELYLNYLDHSGNIALSNLRSFAFMSIAFRAKLDEKKFSAKRVQAIKALNFETECLEETKPFFYDASKKAYRNRPYLEFSFLDLGLGIATTLRDAFELDERKAPGAASDSEILKYAFKYYSSRHPVPAHHTDDQFIPRGLFDVVTLAKRYQGLLLVRSNRAKVVFDYSEAAQPVEGLEVQSLRETDFPGTLISLYIPAIDDTSKLDLSSIRPEFEFKRVNSEHRYSVSFASIYESISKQKPSVYTDLFDRLRKEINRYEEPSLIFLDFAGNQAFEKRIVKKALYFLISTYEVNLKNNIIILNFDNQPLFDEISEEIQALNRAVKNYKLHPVPFVDYDPAGRRLQLDWLGVFDADDKARLKELLFEDIALTRSDFNDPSNVAGHLNKFDKFGNLQTNFPGADLLTGFFTPEIERSEEAELTRLLVENECISTLDEASQVYLCNGNYYQYQYIDLVNLVNHSESCVQASQLLFNRIRRTVGDLSAVKFIGITSSSQKILKSLETQGILSRNDFLLLDTYQTFEDELETGQISSLHQYILICDVISTGNLTKRLSDKLASLGSQLSYVAVFVNTLDPDFPKTIPFLKSFQDKLIFIKNRPIKKYLKEEISEGLDEKEIIRINPFTNIPVTLSINETNFSQKVVFMSEVAYDPATNTIRIHNGFLDAISDEDINIGFLKFNNVIHPYFFETESILQRIDETYLGKIFAKLDKEELQTESNLTVFYPRKSGIEALSIDLVKKLLRNHKIDEVEIERFGTPEGWRFPHNSNYLDEKTKGRVCFILDDGSCSGDSLVQMIDEIAFYDVKEIIVLSFVGRVNDHKREFFSRQSRITVKNQASVPISIFFASHWNIPIYYLENNPNAPEIRWLNDILQLPNTPNSIKKIARRVLAALTPKSRYSFEQYPYLPVRPSDNKIPKKELILVREEIGKVIGYRLYKESFSFFDAFFKKYQKKRFTEDRYKEIELLCASFVYEPYLYGRLKMVVPDIIEQIEDFVKVVIFKNEQIKKRLTYKWDPMDLVHLFFIVFKDKHIIDEVKIPGNFEKLITLTEPKKSALNYVLYKILPYFPMRIEELPEKRWGAYIQKFLYAKRNDNAFAKAEIRKFYHFITTLPSDEDFHNQLASIRDEYARQTEHDLHDERLSFNHLVSLAVSSLVTLINQTSESAVPQEEKITIVRECWMKMVEFVNPILRFAISYKGFLSPYPYFQQLARFEMGENSLRGLVGYNNEAIFSMAAANIDREKLVAVRDNILRIKSLLIVNSHFHQLVVKPTCQLSSILQSIIAELQKSRRVRYDLPENIEEVHLAIPQLYGDLLLIKELVNNINKHSPATGDLETSIKVDSLSEKEILLTLTNPRIKEKVETINGEGLKCIQLMAEFPPFGFSYSKVEQGDFFIQKLKFTVDGN